MGVLDSGLVYEEDSGSVVWVGSRLRLRLVDMDGAVWDIWLRLVKVERDISDV